MTSKITAYLMGNALWEVDAYEGYAESHRKIVDMWREAVRPGTIQQFFATATPHDAFMRAHPDFGRPTLLRSSDDMFVRQSLPDDADVEIYSVQTSPYLPETDLDPTIEVLRKRPGADRPECVYAGRLVEWSNGILKGVPYSDDETREQLLHTIRLASHQFVPVHIDHVPALAANAREVGRDDWAKQLDEIEQIWGTHATTPNFG